LVDREAQAMEIANANPHSFGSFAKWIGLMAQERLCGVKFWFLALQCIFRLHPATCTEKSCHSAGKNLPRYRISLPVITNIGKM
jgi:hypothetical protein